MNKLREMIRKHEGLRLLPYSCSAGKTTIGYGRNLTDNGINKAEAEFLLNTDIEIATREVDLIFHARLPDNVYRAMIDMMFNLGPNRFKTFVKMIQALKDRDWELAGDEMMESKWATQVGSRVQELAGIVVGEKLREDTHGKTEG